MAEGALTGRSPLAAALPPPEPPGATGVVVTERPAAAAFTLMARRGQADALTERCRGFGVVLPGTPRRVTTAASNVTWMGPGRWLVEAEGSEAVRLQRLFGSFAALCAVVATDDARLVLSVAGPKAAQALAKMLTIDLHPRAFRPGEVAMTVAGGIAVLVCRRDDDAPAFDCAVPRSYARSFWAWLLDSASEYGCAVDRAAVAPDEAPAA